MGSWTHKPEKRAANKVVRQQAKKRPEDYGLPPYPSGVVVGPCVCGSWPGGECLRCEVLESSESAPTGDKG